MNHRPSKQLCYSGVVDVNHVTQTKSEPSQFSAIRLFFLGFLTLFLELVLIRFLAGNIWNLGYFPVFLGMGTGFVFHRYLSDSASGCISQAAVYVLLFLGRLRLF